MTTLAITVNAKHTAKSAYSVVKVIDASLATGLANIQMHQISSPLAIGTEAEWQNYVSDLLVIKRSPDAAIVSATLPTEPT